jgi:hypothetical protein
VQALAVDGSSLYVGGSFGAVNGAGRTNLAEVDTGSGALGDLNVAVKGTIQALAVRDGRVYVGGSFGQAHPGLIRISGGAVDKLFNRYRAEKRTKKRKGRKQKVKVKGLVPTFSQGAQTQTLLLRGNRLYVGGELSTTAKRVKRVRRELVAISPDTGKLIRDFDPRVEGMVEAISVRADGTMYS